MAQYNPGAVDSALLRALELFDEAATLAVERLEPRAEVREMCAADRCGAYGKNWACPPACGTLEECAARISRYKRGVIVQSVGELEDSFDADGMEELLRRHAERLERLAGDMRAEFGDVLPLGTGGCRVCGECAHPEPCRCPGRAITSMEACGLVVNQVCTDSGLTYNKGPNKMAYTACVLF